MKNLALVGAVVAFTVFAGAGCGTSRVTIPAWQDRVEQYVKQRGNDPVALRDVTLPGPDARPGFGAIGATEAKQSTDVYGVLLGHRVVAGRPWTFYLAGQVQKERVEEIRLAALSVKNGKYTWRLGDRDPQALEQYRAAGERLWRERFPGRAAAPPQYLSFPRPEDWFDLDVSENRVVVTHRQSGARWELALNASTPSK